MALRKEPRVVEAMVVEEWSSKAKRPRARGVPREDCLLEVIGQCRRAKGE